ncbi:hypothetical protein ABID39_000859 [Bartonella japonica]|uniref:Uncharacterized protein n=1 Tax=Bartonella japonica TaxID=357761 RepID=A0ABV2FNM3_9HYPH
MILNAQKEKMPLPLKEELYEEKCTTYKLVIQLY